MYFNQIDENILLSGYAKSRDLADHPNLYILQEKLGYSFKNIQLLIQSLRHKSFVNEFSHLAPEGNNEKLEFLGDALCDLFITDILLNEIPEAREGDLSKLRSSLVNEEMFASFARFLELNKNLLVGRGEFKAAGHEKNGILSDAFEALIAAVYKDSGIDTARAVFEKIINDYQVATSTPLIRLERLRDHDPKSALQIECHKLFGKAPEYRLEAESDHHFIVSLYINDNKVHTLEGNSKKQVQRELAKYALDNKLYELRGSRC